MERSLSCEEVLLRLDDYLDRELSADEMALVAAHLADCAVCASEQRFEAGVLASIKDKLRRVRMSDTMRAQILARLRHPDSP
ncbi:MAG: zf-HC2 domain-containing protein [Gemmatimonadota bacterium]